MAYSLHLDKKEKEKEKENACAMNIITLWNIFDTDLISSK
jgi:hypothetical protein